MIAAASRGVEAPAGVPRLLDGPPPGAGPESFDSHRLRLDDTPLALGASGAALIDTLDRAGLRGRGGAGFPTARKWRAVADNGARAGGAVVVANGAEGEPLAGKDRFLMTLRPHLVLDGLLLAAEAVGASDAVVYLPRGFTDARAALDNALRQRRLAGEMRQWVRIVTGPHRYVAGEESAVVAHLNGREARPTFVPPRPYQRGVGGLPTLVQNVETLAHAALVARFGDEWFREAGTAASPGTVLLSVRGCVARPGVCEVAQGTPLVDAVTHAGGITATPQAVLVGGYAGGWVPADGAFGLTVDAAALAAAGTPLGCAAIALLPGSACIVAETAAILVFLARESARQCGPCHHGLDAIAGVMLDLQRGRARRADLDRLARWSAQIAGRGACHHPDGAAALLQSLLRSFGPVVQQHLRRRRCAACTRPATLPVPHLEREGWR